MRQLRLVGLAEDGASLVLESPTGESYRLPVDDRVRAACRGDLTRLGQIEIEMDNPLRPREIQMRVRAGESAEQVAASSGMPLDRVLRFASAVLQERGRVVAQARGTAIRPQASDTLGPLVEERLVSRGTDPGSLAWDAWRGDEGGWIVRLAWRHGGERDRDYWATWNFDLARRALQPADPAAEQLSAEEFHARTITAVTPLAMAARAVDEATTRLRPADGRPIDGRPADGRRFDGIRTAEVPRAPEGGRPADHRRGADGPRMGGGGARPADGVRPGPRPTDARPTDASPVDARSAEAGPGASVRAVDATPVDVTPADVSPADTRSADARPTDASPIDAHPAGAPPVASAGAPSTDASSTDASSTGADPVGADPVGADPVGGDTADAGTSGNGSTPSSTSGSGSTSPGDGASNSDTRDADRTVPAPPTEDGTAAGEVPARTRFDEIRAGGRRDRRPGRDGRTPTARDGRTPAGRPPGTGPRAAAERSDGGASAGAEPRPRSGDAQSGDARPGDARSGDARFDGAAARRSRPGDARFGATRDDRRGPRDDATPRSAEGVGDEEPRQVAAAGGATIPGLRVTGGDTRESDEDRARRATVPSWDDILLGVRRRH